MIALSPARPRRWRGAALVAALASALIASPASAAPEAAKPAPTADARAEAKKLSDRAQAHFDLGEYDRAIADFKEAYRLFPSPGLLYNLGQAHRLKGDCAEALTMYRNYLRLAPETPHRAVVEKHVVDMEACEQAHKEALEPATLPPPDTLPSAPPVQPAPVREPEGSGLRLGGIIAASAGAVALAAGGYFSYDAGQAADEVERRARAHEPWGNYEDVDDRGRRNEVIGAVLLATGGAAVVAGATCYALGWRAGRETPTVSVFPAPGRAQMVLTWGF